MRASTFSVSSWGITNTEQIWNRSRKQEKLFVFINPPPTMKVDILRNNTLKMKENTLLRKYFTLSKQEHLFKCGEIFLLNPIICGFKNTSFIPIRLDGTVKRKKKNIYIYIYICFGPTITTLFLLPICMLKCAFLHPTLSLCKKDVVLISYLSDIPLTSTVIHPILFSPTLGKISRFKISRLIIISNIWTEMFIYFKTFHVLSLTIKWFWKD